METSRFEFITPRVVSLSYSENSDFDASLQNSSVEMPISIKHNIHRSDVEPNAIVELEISVGDQTCNTPFFMSVTMGAHFRWEEGSFNDEDVRNLLQKNAVSLLISYARPIIATVTSQSRFPAYDLPFFDLTKSN